MLGAADSRAWNSSMVFQIKIRKAVETNEMTFELCEMSDVIVILLSISAVIIVLTAGVGH